MHGEQRTETTAQGFSNRGGHIKNNKTHTVAIMFHIFSFIFSAARELPFYVISFKSGFRVCTHAEPTNLRQVIRYETIISITSLKSHSQETFFDVM